MRALSLAVAASLALCACGGSGGSTGTAEGEEGAVTQAKLYDIARTGNNAQFDLSWDQATDKDVNRPDPKTGQSLIHYAAANRTSPLMVHAVLMKGADPNLKDAAGLTPLRHAIMANNQVAIRNLMVRSGERIAMGATADAPNVIAVRTDVPGPDGKTDVQTCQAILADGTQHRGCEVMMEMLAGGPSGSTPEQVGGVLRDLGQARQQADLQ